MNAVQERPALARTLEVGLEGEFETAVMQAFTSAPRAEVGRADVAASRAPAGPGAR